MALAQRDPDDVALALQRAQPLLEHLGADDPVRLGLETLATQAPRP